MKKGQASVDLLIVLGILLIVFAILFEFVVYDKFQERFEKQVMLDAREQGEKVAMAINEVYLAGEGTNKTIYLPDNLIHSSKYNVTAYNSGTVIVEVLNKRESTPTLTGNFDNTLFSSGENKIRNVNGVIVFE
ncbi:MAG: hypothetical protein ABIJ18_00310 [archaeon]